jgi:hypothetical protein
MTGMWLVDAFLVFGSIWFAVDTLYGLKPWSDE